VTYIQIENKIRGLFNAANGFKAIKDYLPIGHSERLHEFDLYQPGKVIGGISTNPWKTSNGYNNTGGQDRAAAELLWLSLWSGGEARCHVLTDLQMPSRLSNASGTVHFRMKTRFTTVIIGRSISGL
jgi:hypothetical protein